ncbi:hypothetical protein TNCV_3956451 [Trichonephila clavipes]|nr:hypothetical protein TNCV_3956451 [Trichonephila clavipes]
MMDLEIAFQKKDFNKSSAMGRIQGQMLLNLSELCRSFRLDILIILGTLENFLAIGKKPSSSLLENMTNRLINPTVIDQSHLPASRTNSLRGLPCEDFLLILTSTI